MRVKFGVLEQTQGLHLHGKFYVNVLPVAENHNGSPYAIGPLSILSVSLSRRCTVAKRLDGSSR